MRKGKRDRDDPNNCFNCCLGMFLLPLVLGITPMPFPMKFWIFMIAFGLFTFICLTHLLIPDNKD
jgi:hypothetical protein